MIMSCIQLEKMKKKSTGERVERIKLKRNDEKFNSKSPKSSSYALKWPLLKKVYTF